MGEGARDVIAGPLEGGTTLTEPAGRDSLA